VGGRRVSAALLAKRLAALPRPLDVLFDFDGTLAPLARKPEDAHLPERTRRGLAALARVPGVQVGILSARRVVELARKVQLPEIPLVGLYGLEEKPPGRSLTRRPLAWSRAFWQGLRRELETATAPSGALIEWKTPAIAVHYRGLSAAHARSVRRLVRSIGRRERARVEIRPGSEVLELVPRGTPDKGMAVERMRELCGAGPSIAYFGDSAADEPAFRAVRAAGGVAVRVGPARGRTAATCAIGGPEELGDLLELLVRNQLAA
jgi:trehalose 6-phosphate phosphatase